jgi:methionyl-tRNA formyltransferase
MNTQSKLRLAFMGTPDFVVSPLRALVNAGHDVVAVYSQPPRPAGREQALQKSHVHFAAEELGIEVRTPKTLRNDDEQKKFAALRLDAAVVAGYGLLLPQIILDTPKLGCINIHVSLLPRWRGAAPVQHAMLAGDRETGTTIIKMEAGMDSGPILLQERMPMPTKVTGGKLYHTLFNMGGKLAIDALARLAEKTLLPTPQKESDVTLAPKLSREDGRIDWSKTATEIERQIRALQPWPGTFFMLSDEPVKVLAAEIIAGKSGAPGTLLDEQFTVACGRDALRLLKVQRTGKSAVDGAAFLRGFNLPAGIELAKNSH